MPPQNTTMGDTSEIVAEIGIAIGGDLGGLNVIVTNLLLAMLPTTPIVSTPGGTAIMKEEGREENVEVEDTEGIRAQEVGVATGDVTGGTLILVGMVSSKCRLLLQVDLQFQFVLMYFLIHTQDQAMLQPTTTLRHRCNPPTTMDP